MSAAPSPLLTVVPYLYRDAGNYKVHGTIVLNGVLSAENKEAIRATLADFEKFIPVDLELGIPELQRQSEVFPSEDDHLWHELELDLATEVQQLPPGTPEPIAAAAFVEAFLKVGHPASWDILAAVDRLQLTF